MVIEMNGLQYLVCDNIKVEQALKVKYRSIRSEVNAKGFIKLSAENLEKHVNVDQESLELFYGTEEYKTYADQGIFPFIEINNRILFYSTNWRKYAAQVKIKHKLENIKSISYFPDELEQTLYATANGIVELYITLDSQPTIPFYYRGAIWKNERGDKFINIILPNDDLGNDLKKYTREIMLRINDKNRYEKISIEIHR